MGVKGKPDIIDIIEKKRLQWYGHVKRMPEERIPKLTLNLLTTTIVAHPSNASKWQMGFKSAFKGLIMEWIP